VLFLLMMLMNYSRLVSILRNYAQETRVANSVKSHHPGWEVTHHLGTTVSKGAPFFGLTEGQYDRAR
jgi:hypothetical protein